MRPGLVAVGALLLVVAATSLTAVNLLPGPVESIRVTDDVPPTPTGPNETRSVFLGGTDTSTGSLAVDWSASAPVAVALYEASGCSTSGGPCVVGARLANWPSNASGTAALRAPLAFPYLLVWNVPAGPVVTVSAHAEESYGGDAHLPTLTLLAVDGAGAALAILGGLAVFLGLFLRGGVYRGPAPLVSQSADDAEALGADDGPPRAR